LTIVGFGVDSDPEDGETLIGLLCPLERELNGLAVPLADLRAFGERGWVTLGGASSSEESVKITNPVSFDEISAAKRHTLAACDEPFLAPDRGVGLLAWDKVDGPGPWRGNMPEREGSREGHQPQNIGLRAE
jgi:hypothetical protein